MQEHYTPSAIESVAQKKWEKNKVFKAAANVGDKYPTYNFRRNFVCTRAGFGFCRAV